MGKYLMKEVVKKNLLQIQEEIAPYTPNIIAVTKYFGVDAMIAAYEAGLRDFGESRAIEAIEKINSLPNEVKENSKFHFIGHLQTNKVNEMLKYCQYLLNKLLKYQKTNDLSNKAPPKIWLKFSIQIFCIQKHHKIQKVFIQLNNANEEQKYGFSKEELFSNFEALINLNGLNILGLMNIAPFDVGDYELENLFEDIKQTQNELENKYNCELKEISMGMSNDYQIAAAHGATMLRIGRKLFSTN